MITIRRMEERDAVRAAKLEAQSFSNPWSVQAFRETLQCGYAYYYVAEYTDGTDTEPVLIGMCGLRNIAGEGELTNVATDKAYRRKGIAESVLRRALAEGAVLGINAFTLEVRAGNRAAITLYEKLGFEAAGIRRNFYTNPTEDALIMWKRQETDGTIPTVFIG